MSTLLTLYSSANSVLPMRRKAGKELPGVIDQPCLTIFGTAIPNHYYEALSERMLTNGFFARMLILETGKRAEGQEPVADDPPPSVIETAKWWSEFMPGTGNLERWHPVPRVVDYTPEARDVLSELRQQTDREYSAAEDNEDPVGMAIWARANEKARRLALIYACSENHEDPIIGPPAVEWATAFAMHQTRRQLHLAATYVAENPFHAECLKLLRKLKDSPGQRMDHSALLKRMHMKAAEFRELIQTLVQGNQIEIVTTPRAGAPRVEYHVI